MTIGAVLLDIAGVIHDGEKPLPGALNAIARLREAALPLRFVTNTTRSTKTTILDKFTSFGLRVGDSELFTPTQAALAWMKERGFSPFPLVHPALMPEFANLDQRQKRAVVIGDAGDGFSYENLNAAFREVIAGAPLIALAKNRTFKDTDGQLSLDAGAFVAAVEYASARNAIILGKPAPEFFNSVLASVPCPGERAVMVGDDAESDVAGALRANIGTALLVRTGKYRTGDEERFEPAPTATVSDLSAAVDWILADRA